MASQLAPVKNERKVICYQLKIRTGVTFIISMTGAFSENMGKSF